MSKLPATHKGTCQSCLRVQKLPGGVLAKHGYQVANRGDGGWFAGTCIGSGEKPLELDWRFVEETVIRAHEEVERLEARAKCFEDTKLTTKCFAHVYEPRNGYIWTELELTDAGKEDKDGLKGRDLKWRWLHDAIRYAVSNTWITWQKNLADYTLEDLYTIANYHNREYSDHLRTVRNRVVRQIDYLQAILVVWEQHLLLPLDDNRNKGWAGSHAAWSVGRSLWNKWPLEQLKIWAAQAAKKKSDFDEGMPSELLGIPPELLGKTQKQTVRWLEHMVWRLSFSQATE